MSQAQVGLLIALLVVLGLGVPLLRRSVARQLRAPGTGLLGRWMARIMTSMNRKSSEDAVARLGIREGDTVVELGPGSGWGLRAALAFAPGRLVAVEISERFREELAASDIADRIEIRADDARDLSSCLADGSVDRLLAVNVIYFLEPLGEYARELRRLLQPEGMALLVCKPQLLKGSDPSIFVNKDMSVVRDVLEAEGLTVRQEQVDLEDPRSSYLALWVQRAAQ